MNTRTIRIVLLAAALAASAVSITGAGEQKVPTGKGVAKNVPFSVSGVYTGSLSGEIMVNGQSVCINDKTWFQKVGEGPVTPGTSVSKTAVAIGGVMKGKKAIATLVIIGEQESSADFTQSTIDGAERDPSQSKGR